MLLIYFFYFQQLDLVNSDIQSMSKCCEEMTTRLKVDIVVFMLQSIHSKINPKLGDLLVINF